MTKYEFLLIAREIGLDKTLFYDFYIYPPYYDRWIEYYEYHLNHPDMTQEDIGIHFGKKQSVIQRALSFMKQELTHLPKGLG